MKALTFLLEHSLRIPDECTGLGSECPFAKVDEHYPPPNTDDEGEGYYRCALLDKAVVWGEDPICTVGDWCTQGLLEIEHKPVGEDPSGPTGPTGLDADDYPSRYPSGPTGSAEWPKEYHNNSGGSGPTGAIY